MADRDHLPHDRARLHLVGARHLERPAEGLVGSVRERTLVFRLEDVALEGNDGLVGAVGIVPDGDHVAEGHVLRDEVGEASLQRTEQRLHLRGLSGQPRWVQHAEADARRHESPPTEAIEDEAD